MTQKQIEQLTQTQFGEKLPIYRYRYNVPPTMRTLSELGLGPEQARDMIPVGVKICRYTKEPIYLYKA